MFLCTLLVYSLGALCSFFIYILFLPIKKKKKKNLKAPVFASKLNTLNFEQFLGSSSICELIPSVIVDGELRKGEREGGGVFLYFPLFKNTLLRLWVDSQCHRQRRVERGEGYFHFFFLFKNTPPQRLWIDS